MTPAASVPWPFASSGDPHRAVVPAPDRTAQIRLADVDPCVHDGDDDLAAPGT